MIDLGLDISTLIVAILLAPLAWLWKDRWDKWQEDRRQREEEEREELRLRSEAERDERRHELEKKRNDLELRRRQREELADAFAIHESLTTREVYDAMARARQEQDARDFLVQLHRRASHRYDQFSDSEPLPDGVQTLISDALEQIARLLPTEAADAQTVFEKKVEAKSAGTDRTKYLVDGKRLSKHQTLHALAVRFAKERGITNGAEFSRQWGEIVAEAIGTELAPSVYTGQNLVVDPWAGTPSYQRRYAARDQRTLQELGALELDGRQTLLAWEIGVAPAPADMGRVVHIPVIEHLRDRLGYDVERVA